jgi:hypothetical protein
MRATGLLGSLIIAVVVAIYAAVWVGLGIAFAAIVFQLVLSYGRSQASTKVINSPLSGALADIVRNGVFLIPLILAIVVRSWFGIIAVIVSYLLTLMTVSYSSRRI